MNILVGWDVLEYPEASAFRSLGKCDFVRYDKDFLCRNIQSYDILIPNLDIRIGRALLRKAKRLRILATPTTGIDHFDKEAAEAMGIQVLSLNDDPELLLRITSTAEHTWLLILAAARRLRRAFDRVIAQGSWHNTDIRGRQLRDLTVGIVGYGRIGRMVENYAKAFGMKALIHDPKHSMAAYGKTVTMAALLAQSDIITLHAKWLPGQPPVIDAGALKKIKTGAILVNTSRGGLVDAKAVLAALRSGKLASVAVDVACEEYQEARLPRDPLVRAARTNPDIIVTPHVAGATFDAHRVVFHALARMVRDRRP